MPLFKFLKKSDGTNSCEFKKKKKIKIGSKQYTLKHSLKASLGKGQHLKDCIKLPDDENLNEWIAMNTIEMYNNMNLCYGIVNNFCTPLSCPHMTAGPKATYYWAANKKEKPQDLPANEYVDKVVEWIIGQLEDSTLFPEHSDGFTPRFLPAAKKILSRMFRVYAHIYLSHWEKVKSLEADAHLNTCFKHFYYFTKEFGLIDPKEMTPLDSIIAQLCN
jgi:MOB kinase activator 1